MKSSTANSVSAVAALCFVAVLPAFAQGRHNTVPTAHAGHSQPPSHPVTPGHGHGGLGGTQNAAVYVVPYRCGDTASVRYVNGGLTIKSDANYDAGFGLYTSQTTTTVPFAPGVLAFNISGSQLGDTLELVEVDQSDNTNGQNLLITNGPFRFNLSTLTTQKIKKLFVLVGTTRGSTIIENHFTLAGHALPVDLTQVATCSAP